MEEKLRSKIYESRGKTESGPTLELLRSEVLKDVATNQQGQDNEKEDEVLPVGNENEEIADHSYLMIIGNSNGNEENQAYNYANNSAAHLKTEKLYFVNLGDNHHQMQENGSPKIYYLMMVGDLPAQVSTTVADVEKVTKIHSLFPCRMRDCQKRFFHKVMYKKHKKRHIQQKMLMWDLYGISAATGNLNEKKNQDVSFQKEKTNETNHDVNDAESRHEDDDDDVITDESNDLEVRNEGSQKSSTFKDASPEYYTTEEKDFSHGDNDEENDDSDGNDEVAKKLPAVVLLDCVLDKDKVHNEDDSNLENQEGPEYVYAEAEIAEVTQSATCVSSTGEDHESMITDTQVLSRTNSVPPAPHHSRTNQLTQSDSVHARTRSKARNEISSNEEPPLNVHAKTKNIERVEAPPFKCEVCAIKFRSKYNYNRHREKIHMPPKCEATCPTCAKVFSRKDSLKRHIDQVHTNRSEWKFPCPEKDCPMRFPCAAKLKEHMVRHESSKQHRCPNCWRKFKYERNLKRHVKNSHGKDSKRKFQCPIEDCGKRFHYPAQLTRHMVMHESPKQLPCPNCWKLFKNDRSLKDHMIKFHPNGSEWKCPEKDCESRFTCPSQFKNHMESHTHHKQFMCDRCGTYFGYRHNLNRHVRKRICRPSA